MVLADAYVNVRDSLDVKGLIDAAHLLERLPSLPCLRFVTVRGLDMASAFFSKTLSCPSWSPTLTPSCITHWHITHCTSRTAPHALHGVERLAYVVHRLVFLLGFSLFVAITVISSPGS